MITPESKMPKLKQTTLTSLKITPKTNKSKMPKLKQATISSLKGVVVVEDFQRQKNVLENASETKENILSTLQYLKSKKPRKEVIVSIGIEKSLELLKHHSDKEVAEAALDLYEYWELHNDKPQPTIEVRYDNLTKHIRRNAVKLFTQSLGGQEEDEKLAEILEKEVFHKYKRLISKEYRRAVRKLVFTLRHNEAEKIALKEGTVTQVQFVKKHSKAAI